jgi:hypothetical protein
MLEPLKTVRAAEIEPATEEERWLIESLWPDSAVGVLGGQPKSFKTFLALDLAISVASGTPCLGRYAVATRSRALVYLAEDALLDVRSRIEGIAKSRGLGLEDLDLDIIAEPVLRLDQETDQRRLQQTIERMRPRLLVLDPLVRLHRLDENSSSEISALLGYLRGLQRSHDVSVALVHHSSKRAHARHGQALRGTSDLHAWVDVGLYLTWQGDRLRMTPELRTARAPGPVELELVSRDPSAVHLEIRGGAGGTGPIAAQATLAESFLAVLEDEAPRSIRRTALRKKLRVNNARLGAVLAELEAMGLAHAGDHGWKIDPAGDRFPRSVPAAPCAHAERNAERLPGETDLGPAGMQPGKG